MMKILSLHVTTFKPEAENIELQPVHNDPETTV